MNLSRKNLILLIIIGILVSGIPVITLYSSYCSTAAADIDSAMNGNCPFSVDSFVTIAMVSFATFVLPRAGLSLVGQQQFIARGAYWPLLKPPRIAH
jgi:hypothetical protein